MKVLWITNIVFPEANSLLGGSGSLKTSGGWMIGASENLIKQPDVQLTVASVSDCVTNLTRLEGDNIIYYLLPKGKGNQYVNHEYEKYWVLVKDEVKPDVIHLHGTEFSHGLAYVEACGAEHVCVSIQGLVSVYYRYYYSGLTKFRIYSNATLYSLIKGSIFSGARSYKRRGTNEVELLRRVNHILGRTSWDKAHTWAINPNAHFYHAGETLRSVFYESVGWSYEKCTPHTIFLSQSSKPLKGLHMLLKSMPLILRHYPDTKVRIAGTNVCKGKNMMDRMKLTDYGNIIRELIKKNKLEGHIQFIGPLDEDGMRNEYLNCNVFVCPSSIENSPNSLGEAQLLGVPVVASYVGGICDMMKGVEDNMYRFEEVEMLAFTIVSLFDKQGNIDTDNMKHKAFHRHNPQNNTQELVEIYRAISNDC